MEGDEKEPRAAKSQTRLPTFDFSFIAKLDITSVTKGANNENNNFLIHQVGYNEQRATYSAHRLYELNRYPRTLLRNQGVRLQVANTVYVPWRFAFNSTFKLFHPPHAALKQTVPNRLFVSQRDTTFVRHVLMRQEDVLGHARVQFYYQRQRVAAIRRTLSSRL